jgi:hypothetical protein
MNCIIIEMGYRRIIDIGGLQKVYATSVGLGVVVVVVVVVVGLCQGIQDRKLSQAPRSAL